MTAAKYTVDPWLPLDEHTDRQLMAALLLTITPDEHKRAQEYRLYREIERRVSYVLREHTRSLPDAEAAYREALYDLMTETSARYYVGQFQHSLAAFAKQVAKRRTTTKAGLLDQTSRNLRPVSLDQMAEETPERVPAEASANQTWDELEAGHVDKLRERFEEIVQSALEPDEVRAIEEYANLWALGRVGLETRETVGKRMRVHRTTASRAIESAQRKIAARDRLMGNAIRALIKRSAETWATETGDATVRDGVERSLRTYAKAA
jgi:hypothetical protein